MFPSGFGALQLSELQLLNYDAAVTQEVLQPLSHLKNLSVFHLYSVPGPICHLQTWLASLQQLCSLSVHGDVVKPSGFRLSRSASERRRRTDVSLSVQ